MEGVEIQVEHAVRNEFGRKTPRKEVGKERVGWGAGSWLKDRGYLFVRGLCVCGFEY